MIPRRPALARRPVFSRSLLSRRIAFPSRPAAKRRQPVAYHLARVAVSGARTRSARARGALTRRLTVQRQVIRRSGRHRGTRGRSWGLSGGPRQIAQQMLSEFGWSASQFSCLDSLWMHESGWNVYAENPSSGAYGIPQALPGGKMASAGADWRVDAATQIRWGLGYIQDTYGSPCGAWGHEEARGWY